MIEFVSVTKPDLDSNAILILAESEYDETILGNDTNWMWVPELGKPHSCTLGYDCNNSISISDYVHSLKSSNMALAVLTASVEASNKDKHILIGCYDLNVTKSHLATLLDFVEDEFVAYAPELRMVGV